MAKLIRPEPKSTTPPVLTGDAASIAARSLAAKRQGLERQKRGGGGWLIAVLVVGILGAVG